MRKQLVPLTRAEQGLAESCYKLAWLQAYKFASSHKEEYFDNVVSDSMYALVRSVQCFDPTKGFKLTSYVGQACDNFMHNSAIVRRRHSESTTLGSLPNAENLSLACHDFDQKQRIAEAREFAHFILSKIKRRRHRMLMSLIYVDGLNITEAAEALGMSKALAQYTHSQEIARLRNEYGYHKTTSSGSV